MPQFIPVLFKSVFFDSIYPSISLRGETLFSGIKNGTNLRSKKTLDRKWSKVSCSIKTVFFIEKPIVTVLRLLEPSSRNIIRGHRRIADKLLI